MSFLRSAGNILGFILISIYTIVEHIVKFFVPTKYKMKSISGEVALVTGGAGGLGRLLALRLADLGAIVVIWDIDEKGIDEVVKLVRAAGGTCYGYKCDICDREDVYKKAAIVEEEVGKVTILINNAGMVTGTKFLDTPDTLLVKTMNVNFMSHFWTVKAFLPSMMKNNRGHIVSISSMAGHVGIAKLVDYCASKFAVVGFDEALRMELESEGYSSIKTTIICPYFIRSTGMFGDVKSSYLPILRPNYVADRVITALRCDEKFAILPGYLQLLLCTKWIFPWPCVAMFLRGLVQDASPSVIACPVPSENTEQQMSTVHSKENGSTIHHQLARRVLSSERKP